MKKLFFILVFIASIAQAQYKIVGTLQPKETHKTAILYKIVGAKQDYVKNTKIENGSFIFNMNENDNPGVYRVTYDTKNGGFVDFFYNREDVIFAFSPKDPENTKTFSISDGNKLYGKFIQAISYVQYEVDSLQVDYLKNPSKKTAELYKNAVKNINTIQEKYTKESEGKLIKPFVEATNRYNSAAIATTPNAYLDGIKMHFFDNIDLENKALYNSPFLVDRISDYVFYINYSDDVNTQNKLHKEAISEVINKIKNPVFKKDIIEFLVNKFTQTENTVLVDYLFENHFDKLPTENKNLKFKENILTELKTAVGRTAPDFSWQENGKNIKLSSLNDGKNYILTFYSTTCPHCVDEIPKLYDFLKDKPNTKVIAFAMEENDFFYKKFTKNLQGWHNVLGLNKWENKIARIYNINSTPTYFVLDADKKIIAKPDYFEDIQKLFK